MRSRGEARSSPQIHRGEVPRRRDAHSLQPPGCRFTSGVSHLVNGTPYPLPEGGASMSARPHVSGTVGGMGFASIDETMGGREPVVEERELEAVAGWEGVK